MTTHDTQRQDIYSRITDQIIAHLEMGVKPWTQPWKERAVGFYSASAADLLPGSGFSA